MNVSIRKYTPSQQMLLDELQTQLQKNSNKLYFLSNWRMVCLFADIRVEMGFGFSPTQLYEDLANPVPLFTAYSELFLDRYGPEMWRVNIHQNEVLNILFNLDRSGQSHSTKTLINFVSTYAHGHTLMERLLQVMAYKTEYMKCMSDTVRQALEFQQ